MLKNTNNCPGVIFECKRLSPQEYSAKFKKAPESNIAYLQLESSGFKPMDRFKFYLVDMVFSKKFLADMTVNDHGSLIFACNALPLEDIEFAVANCMKGEQVFYVLESEDKQTCLTASFTADPIEYRWEDGAYAYAAMLSPDASLFSIIGKGFLQNEQLTIISKTCGETLAGNFEAYSDGTINVFLLPSVVNVKGAPGKLTIQRQSSEIGSLNYLWGTLAIDLKQCK